MPRLSAEAAFRLVEQIGVGTGSLKSEIATAVMQGWQRDLDQNGVTSCERPPRTVDAMSAQGIKVYRPKSAQ